MASFELKYELRNERCSPQSLCRVKFPHSPSYIMHSVLEQRKQWQKQYISIGKTDLFYNGMGLCRNFTIFSLADARKKI